MLDLTFRTKRFMCQLPTRIAQSESTRQGFTAMRKDEQASSHYSRQYGGCTCEDWNAVQSQRVELCGQSDVIGSSHRPPAQLLKAHEAGPAPCQCRCMRLGSLRHATVMLEHMLLSGQWGDTEATCDVRKPLHVWGGKHQAQHSQDVARHHKGLPASLQASTQCWSSASTRPSCEPCKRGIVCCTRLYPVSSRLASSLAWQAFTDEQPASARKLLKSGLTCLRDVQLAPHHDLNRLVLCCGPCSLGHLLKAGCQLLAWLLQSSSCSYWLTVHR